MTRKVLSIIAIIVCALSFSVSTAAAAGKLRVVYGFDREFPPFSFENPGGKETGFEVEILQAIFKDALVPRPMQWNLIPTELAAGNITITSGMVKTEERARLFAFADKASFVLPIRLFSKTFNRYPNAAFLRGQRVSVEQGSYQHHLLQMFGGINIKPFKDKVSPIKALYNEEVEAYCGPVQNAYYYMNKLGYSGISTLGTPLGIAELRFAVNRDRGDILRMLNEGMKQLAASGEYDRIYRKWFVRELTSEENLKLLNAAKEGVQTAYTPYGRVSSGAAVFTATGRVHTGSAVENANKNLNVSALTTALVSAVTAADLEILAAIMVDADGRPMAMTPTDLQLLNEFGRGILVLAFNEEGLFASRMVGELLPSPTVVTAVPAQRQ